MTRLVAYDDSDSSDDASEHTKAMLSLPRVNAAPNVYPQVDKNIAAIAYSSKQLTRNIPFEFTGALSYGPRNDFVVRGNRNVLELEELGGSRQIVTGAVEPTTIDDLSFDAQYHDYNKRNAFVQHAFQKHDYSISNIPAPPPIEKPQPTEAIDFLPIQKRQKVYLSEAERYGNEAEHGIWAPEKVASEPMETPDTVTVNELKAKRVFPPVGMDAEIDFDRMIEKKKAHLLPARLLPGQEAMPGKSVFLDSLEFDYQGRSWVEPPKYLKPHLAEGQDVFLPKKCIHKWAGHNKGVQAIEFFPKYGHLLLSASMDHTVRIWDVYNEKKCKRLYEGHGAAVRGINFSPNGSKFLSCSFDRFIHLWDVETGKSLHQFTNRRVPYCIKFHPEDESNFVIGDSNNMIVQFDTRSGEIVQEYNHHLQSVNTVTFVSDNSRFISTSDDKKILIWEWGIPVPIKYISEPSMQAMPAVTLHPSGDFFAGQSLNNQIDVYSAKDKFKICRKKVFRGHSNAGYACQIGFSPNGQYLISGDGEGKLCFWDWKSTKLYKKFKAHDHGPCIGALWHPLETSKVASCGWDGSIKFWD